jgi:hypothetical protein
MVAGIVKIVNFEGEESIMPTVSVRQEVAMAQSLTASWKNDVTCDLWSGPRGPSHWRDRVEYSDDNVKGECIGGGWDRQQMRAMSTCNKWVKWSVLK